MTTTEQMIASLAADAKPVRPLTEPGKLTLRLTLVLAIYVALMSFALGLRPDLLLQLLRPGYLAEIVSLFTVVFTSLVAATYQSYPDLYQNPAVGRWPVMAIGGFMVLLAFQYVFPAGTGAVMHAGPEVHAVACTLCIAAVAVAPSTLMVWLLRKGASTEPVDAAAYAILAATATGCLVLRLIEPSDVPLHLLIWHYVPTFVFASLGGIAGKYLLKW